MRTKAIVLAVLATGFLLVGAAGAAVAQPDNPGQSGDDGPSGDAGPPGDLPGPVPDFVSDIHTAINDFLSGGVENLGEAVSDLTPGEESGQENADGSDADGDAGDA